MSNVSIMLHVIDSGKVLQLVMIDTVLLCGNTDHDHVVGHSSTGTNIH